MLVRTASHPAVKTLEGARIAYTPLDFLYGRSRNYDTLVKKIVREVKARAKSKDVCYCVDGAPEEDAAARILLKGKGVVAIGGISKGAYLASAAQLFEGYTAVSAFELQESALALPLVVYDVTEDIVSEVKLLLAEKFGDESPAVYVNGEKAERGLLYEADRRKYGAVAGIVLPTVSLLEKKRFTFEDFVAILKRLRAPDGCPWDRAQTHESIRINCIEEAYELVDAIDRNDEERMLEETGDVLMQALFHALIEEEKGGFSVTDMLTAVSEKLITRHTHVFGQDQAQGADGALSVWDKNKMKEKHQETFADAINDVPEGFPALLRAQKIAKRAEKGGWDKPSIELFERKFREEYGELLKAYQAGDGAQIAEELGDVLMCVVELGRTVGAECEQALLDTVKKVQARYTAYEALVLAEGKNVHTLTQAEKDEYYQRAKNASRN